VTADTTSGRCAQTDSFAMVGVLIDLILGSVATRALDVARFFLMRDFLDVTMARGALFISMNGCLEFDRIDRIVTGETIIVRDPLQCRHRDRAEKDREDRQKKNRINLFHKVVLCSMREVAAQNGWNTKDFFTRRPRYDIHYTAFLSTPHRPLDPDA